MAKHVLAAIFGRNETEPSWIPPARSPFQTRPTASATPVAATPIIETPVAAATSVSSATTETPLINTSRHVHRSDLLFALIELSIILDGVALTKGVPVRNTR